MAASVHKWGELYWQVRVIFGQISLNGVLFLLISRRLRECFDFFL